MPPPKKILRGLANIRTHSGTSDGVTVPYKAYMAVTTLELEKFRRETERANLLTRLESISTRLRFIESEKTALLRRLGARPTRPHIENPMTRRRPGSVQTRAGFKMKY